MSGDCCSYFLVLGGFCFLQKACFTLFLNCACVSILDIRLAQLNKISLANIVTPDQALAPARIHAACGERLQEV